MDDIRVKTADKEYSVHIRNDFSYLEEALKAKGLLGKKLMCVCDSNVAPIYIEEISRILKPLCKVYEVHIFPAGEESKNLSSVETIYNKLMEAEFERSSVIVALGGGVTGDLAGFAAATYMRGIKYIQIPTTLLAQVDSSVGGKVGVDFCGAKNMVGTFYSPEMVYANTSTLSTLPKEHFLSGMGEIIKYGLIYDRGFLSFLANNADNIMNLRNDEIFHAIKRSVSIKAQVVACDERDNGIRRILNFGHTFGHAVESRLNYSLPHGICVGLGMVCAMYLSKVQGFIAENDYGFFIEIMSKYGLPLKVKGVNAGELYEMALKDKKVNDSKLTVILLDRIGSGFAEDNISKEQVLKAFEQII